MLGRRSWCSSNRTAGPSAMPEKLAEAGCVNGEIDALAASDAILRADRKSTSARCVKAARDITASRATESGGGRQPRFSSGSEHQSNQH